MERELILTNDGSHSLLVTNMGETFHSKHGAVQESLHVYIKNGLEHVCKNPINVLEFGFGTGLNALLTMQYASENNVTIHYETIEAYPLVAQEYQALNYNNFVETTVSLQHLHELACNKLEKVTAYFNILKHFCKIEDFASTKLFDIIYFDVFGYDYQSELWSEEILRKAYNFLQPNGIFVTYACKGLINRRLKEIGFKVKKLQGPPGKREMVFAVKKI